VDHPTLPTFDGLNRMVVAIDQLSFSTSFTFDANGRNTVIEDPNGGLISMAYSARNEMVSVANQVGLATSYSFDPVGNRLTRQFANGQQTTYSYDGDRRQLLAIYADGTLLTFAYDNLGNRLRMVDSTGQTTFSYDAANRYGGKTDPGPFVQAILYDITSQRKTLSDSDGGITTYGYDWDARTTIFETPDSAILTMSYDGAARLTTENFNSGFSRSRSYDANNQLIRINETGAAGTIGFWTFGYDSVRNRQVVADLPSNLSTYTMDAKSRLISDDTTGPNAHDYAYSYDSRDNRLTSNETGPLATWAYDAASRIIASNAAGALTSSGYDSNGNLTQVNKGGALSSMTYDVENRLALYEDSTNTATYMYSGDGLKRVELVNGALATLVWDGTDYYGGI